MDNTFSSIVLFLFPLLFYNILATELAVAGGGHFVPVASLIPPTTCSYSTPKVYRKSSLEVVHRHGPCAGTDGKKTTASELLTEDELRVKSIQSRAAHNSGKTIQDTDSVSIPAKSGRIVSSANYIVTVGVGTPATNLSLIFDTGSDLTWTQCQPCAGYCYPQEETIFDPSLSKSYAHVPCNSPECDALISATGNAPFCEASTNSCIYDSRYGDQSFSLGYFASENLTLSSNDVIPNFLFGCGQNSRGSFKGAAGILGLGRNSLSIVSLTAGKYGKYFSYCLPSSPSATGHLTFGKGKTENIDKAKFTPLYLHSEFYFIDIVGLKVGEKLLPVARAVTSNPPRSIIDSGTVITRLPADVYRVLRTEFRRQMRKYRLTYPIFMLDTCYDFRRYNSVLIPNISIFFGGNVEVELKPDEVLYTANRKQICFAFAGNRGDEDLSILGNFQQKSLEVVYDVDGGKLGFISDSCL